jgi:hypothetical protein
MPSHSARKDSAAISCSVDSKSRRAPTASRNDPAGALLIVRNSSRMGSNRSNTDSVSCVRGSKNGGYRSRFSPRNVAKYGVSQWYS